MSSNSSSASTLWSSYMVNEDTRYILSMAAIVLSFVTVLVGISGNSLVIWVAGFKLKATVTNVWLVNLAVADFIFSCTQVFYMYKTLSDDWIFGLFLCQCLGLLKYANMFCSVFLLAVISVDRALSIWKPIFMKRHRTLAAARLVAVCVWVTAIVLSSPYFLYRQVYATRHNLTPCVFATRNVGEGLAIALNLNRFLAGFILPFAVILVSYAFAAVGIKRTRLVGKARPLRILASLVIAFFVCWAPYHSLLLLRTVSGSSKIVTIFYPLASGLAYFNSCVNPVLYFCMGLKAESQARHSLLGVYKRALAEDMNNQNSQSTPCSLEERNASKQMAAAEDAGDRLQLALAANAKV